MDAARDVMGAVRDVIPVACEALLSKMLLLLWLRSIPCFNATAATREALKYMTGSDNKLYTYDKNMPIVFIGGMPRSGTTLIRALLDAHPHIRCGEETRVIPRVLNLKHMWSKSEVEATRLAEAGITTEVLDAALAAFILEIIARHGEPAPRLCNKDPFTLRSAIYLNGLFPNSKFVLMVRDGRAVVHSIISRKVTITGFNLSDYRQCLTKWNSAMQNMHTQCSKLGPELCIHVYYEQLVLHPKLWLERILNFLDVPWNDSVLHHDKFINKPGGVSLSKLEKSSDQVIKPINLDALTTWVGQMPDDVVADMHKIAPMLSVLGYDPHSNPPDYGKPDTFVVKNTNDINKNKQNWERKGNEYRMNAKQLAKEKGLNKNKHQKNISISNQASSTAQ
ncbi:Protein-tyrosine sulfotransferase [Nymphon striatum]|nr:Protein-tyrosine sulfotransferase [Nymphon striatum]